jgi:hypothetical protein
MKDKVYKILNILFFVGILALLLFNVFYISNINVVASNEVYIYIHNKPYKGNYFLEGNRIYVNLEQFIKLTNIKYYKVGNYYVLSKSNIVPPSNFKSLVYYNTTPLKYVLLKDNVIYVDLFELAYLTNSKVDYNKDTGIIDYYDPKKIEQVYKETYAKEVIYNKDNIYNVKNELYNKKGIQVGQKAEEIPEDAIKLVDENKLYDDRNNRGELRYQAAIINNYKEVIKDIVVKVKVVSPGNDVLYEQTFKYPSLKPGEKQKFDIYWINNTMVVSPQVKVEIDFKGKKKEKN